MHDSVLETQYYRRKAQMGKINYAWPHNLSIYNRYSIHLLMKFSILKSVKMEIHLEKHHNLKINFLEFFFNNIMFNDTVFLFSIQESIVLQKAYKLNAFFKFLRRFIFNFYFHKNDIPKNLFKIYTTIKKKMLYL